MQCIRDALSAVPLQFVQIVTDRVVLILMGNYSQRLADAVFVVQTVSVFQIQHEIVEVRVVHSRSRPFPPKMFANVDASGKNVVADCSVEHRIGHKYLIYILHGILHLLFFIQFQKAFDFLRRLAEPVLCHHIQILSQLRC